MDEDAKTVKFLNRSFPVYESNTVRIGELGADTCESVVHFYDVALEYLGALSRYLEMEHEQPYPDECTEQKKARQTEFFKRKVSGRLDELRAAAVKAEGKLSIVKSASN